MRHFRGRIEWTPRSGLTAGLAVMLVMMLSQVSSHVRVWLWGPNTGHRLAGLTGGHFEWRYPGILQGGPDIGYVLMAKGDTLTLDYDLTVNEGGVSFAVRRWPAVMPGNQPTPIGPRLIERSGTGRIAFTADRFGYYRIYMVAHRWQGAVRADWHTRAAPATGRGLGAMIWKG